MISFEQSVLVHLKKKKKKEENPKSRELLLMFLPLPFVGWVCWGPVKNNSVSGLKGILSTGEYILTRMNTEAPFPLPAGQR